MVYCWLRTYGSKRIAACPRVRVRSHNAKHVVKKAGSFDTEADHARPHSDADSTLDHRVIARSRVVAKRDKRAQNYGARNWEAVRHHGEK